MTLLKSKNKRSLIIMFMLSQTYIGKYYEGSQELSVSTKSIPGQITILMSFSVNPATERVLPPKSIVLQKANQSYSVRSIDIHNSSCPEHLFPIFKSSNICPHKLMHTTRQFQQRWATALCGWNYGITRRFKLYAFQYYSSLSQVKPFFNNRLQNLLNMQFQTATIIWTFS